MKFHYPNRFELILKHFSNVPISAKKRPNKKVDQSIIFTVWIKKQNKFKKKELDQFKWKSKTKQNSSSDSMFV